MNRNDKQCKNHPNWQMAQDIKSKRIQEQKANRISIYNRNPQLCQQCNQAIEYGNKKNKFCSQSCAATFNNKHKPIKSKQIQCMVCENTFLRMPHSKQTYCSTTCSASHRSQITFDKNQNKKRVNRGTQRRYLIRKHGHKCSTCNRIEWNGQPIPIELDHIDGCAANNKEENLRLLCPNCHAQTPTYKARNKGKGRQSLGMISC